ncbi:hypothetical protein SERLA73DRAFT_53017, partial [Serpula lacrymans var. lacrymans S7.3]
VHCGLLHYDVCRVQNVINPKNLHCNVMLLYHYDNTGTQSHLFCYARVLGIYHANIVYVDFRTTDYQSH